MTDGPIFFGLLKGGRLVLITRKLMDCAVPEIKTTKEENRVGDLEKNLKNFREAPYA